MSKIKFFIKEIFNFNNIKYIKKFFSHKQYTFEEKIDLDLVERPHYAYTVQKAAWLGKALGLPKISIIEFGVAGGNGLLLLQEYASIISSLKQIDIKVLGFDTGVGMPISKDPKDLPYLWFEGDFTMDEKKLRSRLNSQTNLIIGNIESTIYQTENALKEFPVGGIIFDMDYYSSTIAAMKIFDLPEECYLPRVICYLDNIIARAEFPINEYVAELAAVKEFNKTHQNKKIGKLNCFSHKRKKPAKWNEQVYIFQDFKHSLYSVPVRERRDEKTKLKGE